MMKQLLTGIFFLLCCTTFVSRLHAQELQCVVNVSAPTLGSDKQVYGQLQDAITKYVNFRKWTDLKYGPKERISCRIQLLIDGRPSAGRFKGTLQVQLIRPVYNSTFESLVVNIQDKQVAFEYVPFSPLEFSENAYTSELASILDFYAYMLIGFDQETFQVESGTPYFERAMEITNLAGAQGGGGWTGYGAQRNRFWLVSNMLDNTLKQIHNIFYVYHRQGLDQMEKNVGLGRASVLGALKELNTLNQRYPTKYITRVFVTAKASEIREIFRKADVRQKRELITVMEKLDPANISEYQALLKEK
ncbi:MAG TPA: DUF4835 family protein [Bacteroidetes bacterium]|nr:DUF4835 family protein [Bacteroidota bacterium]